MLSPSLYWGWFQETAVFMHFQLKEREKKNFCNYTCFLMLSKRDQTSHPEHKPLFCCQQLIDIFPQTAPVPLNLNHGSRSRLDMTSLQQVAQFVPRVFNHQDCHHNGWVNQWLIKEGPSVPTSQIRCVYASNGLETDRRTVFPLFHHLMGDEAPNCRQLETMKNWKVQKSIKMTFGKKMTLSYSKGIF